MSGDCESDDESWEEVVEDLDEDLDMATNARCLFCSLNFTTPIETFIHCAKSHNFNIQTLRQDLKLDCFGYIKLINYIRKTMPKPDQIYAQLTQSPLWMADTFMVPTITNDPLLMFDIETLAATSLCPHYSQRVQVTNTQLRPGCDHRMVSGQTTVDVKQYNDLVQKYAESTGKLGMMEVEMNRCLGDINQMRNTYKTLLANTPNPTAAPKVVSAFDDGYFSGYAHFSIHHEMLRDKSRTEAFRNFMTQNPSVIKDKMVLDVGCGTGILSMFAATAGASHVTAIDQSDIIIHTMDIIRENELQDKIKPVKGRIEDTALPHQQYDIIISEWMGYFLLYESMLESILFARDRYLRPNGMVYPDRCSISIAAIDDEEKRAEYLEFWDDVYGFQMTSIKKDVCKEACVTQVSPDSLMSRACILKNFDLMTCIAADIQFTSDFTLSVDNDCNMTGLVAFFSVFFERGLTSQVTLSTSPQAEATHWKQTVLYLPTPRPAKSGDVISGSLTCRKKADDPRGLTITVKMFDEIYNYIMP